MKQLSSLWLKLELTVFSFLLMVRASPAYALDRSDSDGNVMLDYLKRLPDYTSKVYFEKGLFGLEAGQRYLINNIVQGVFWVTKAIFIVCASGYYYLMESFTSGQGTTFDVLVSKVLSAAAETFNILNGELGTAAVIAWSMYLVYAYFVQGGKFSRALLRMFLTLACAQLFFYRTSDGYLAQTAYNQINTISKTLVSDIVRNNKLAADQVRVAGQTEEGVVDYYFNIAIYEPYVEMNTSNHDTALADALLPYRDGDAELEIYEGKKIDKIAGTQKEPLEPMLRDNWGQKFLVAFSSLVDAAVLGILLLAIAVGTLVLKLVFLLLLLVAAFAVPISMFPALENSLLSFGKRMVGIIALSNLTQFAAIVLLFFYDLLNDMLSNIGVTSQIASAGIKALVIFLMYRNRRLLGSLLLANGLRLKGRRLSQLYNRSQPNVSQTTDAGSLSEDGAGSEKLGNVRMNRFQAARHRVSRMALGATYLLGNKTKSHLSQQMVDAKVKAIAFGKHHVASAADYLAKNKAVKFLQNSDSDMPTLSGITTGNRRLQMKYQFSTFAQTVANAKDNVLAFGHQLEASSYSQDNPNSERLSDRALRLQGRIKNRQRNISDMEFKRQQLKQEFSGLHQLRTHSFRPVTTPEPKIKEGRQLKSSSRLMANGDKIPAQMDLFQAKRGRFSQLKTPIDKQPLVKGGSTFKVKK